MVIAFRGRLVARDEDAVAPVEAVGAVTIGGLAAIGITPVVFAASGGPEELPGVLLAVVFPSGES